MSKKEKIIRHSGVVRAVHWSVVISTFTLIMTGIFQMPMPKRYMIDQLPGLAWSADFSTTLIIHYLAATVLLMAVAVHIFYHSIRKEYNLIPRRGDVKESILIVKAMFGFGQEPKSDKYLPEQRLAYVFIAFSFFIIITTGILKVIKNLPGVNMPDGVLFWVTNLHNTGTVLIILGIIAHLIAFAIKANWPLVPSMFTGKVDLQYAKNRHIIWYDKIKSSK